MRSPLIWFNLPGFQVKVICVLHRIHHSWQFGCHTFMLAFIIFILKPKKWKILSFIAPTAGFSGAMCVRAAQVWSPGCVMVWMGLQRADSVTNYVISLNTVNSTFIYLRNLIFFFKWTICLCSFWLANLAWPHMVFTQKNVWVLFTLWNELLNSLSRAWLLFIDYLGFFLHFCVRTSHAQGKADSAVAAAQKAQEESRMARGTAKQFSPSFQRPGNGKKSQTPI